MKSSDDLRSQLARSMALATTIGLDVACVLMVCVLLGNAADGKLGTRPIGLVIGILVGLVGSGYSAYALVRRMFQ